MRYIRYVEGRRLQNLRIWVFQELTKVEEGGDHEGEVLVDVMELGWLKVGDEHLRLPMDVLHLQLSSPSKIPGIPTRSKGIPSSASASILSG